MGSTNNTTSKTRNTTTTSKTQKLLLLGAGLGLAVFVGQALANIFGGWIYTLMVGPPGISYNTATAVSLIAQIVAFILLFVGARIVFKRADLRRANQIAAASIVATYMFAKLFSVAIKTSGFALTTSRILLYVLIGSITTFLFARLFERVKDDERAALIAFVAIVVILFGISWLTDYFQQNSRLILGY